MTREQLDRELKTVTDFLDSKEKALGKELPCAFIVIAVSEVGFTFAIDERISQDMQVEIFGALKNRSGN